jgi:hypothetical protein
VTIVGFYSPAMGSGKTTLAAAMRGHGFVRVPFAGPLKSMLRALLAETGAEPSLAAEMLDGTLKETQSPLLCGRTPRLALQTLGTEWGRSLMAPNFWVEIWRQRVALELSRGHNVVADDMRFPNEAEVVRQMGGMTVRIDRPGTSTTTAHASEGGLDVWDFDLRLLNDGPHAIAWALSGCAAIGRAMQEGRAPCQHRATSAP